MLVLIMLCYCVYVPSSFVLASLYRVCRVLLKLLFNGGWWYCIRYAALSAMSVEHSALPTYNAALNRPAYQSSVYTDGRGSYGANLANDGYRETKAPKNNTPTCVISQSQTNLWWAVDLGRPTTIYRVDFTNRGNSGLERCSYVVSSFARFSNCLVLCILHMADVPDIILSFSVSVTLMLMKFIQEYQNC